MGPEFLQQSHSRRSLPRTKWMVCDSFGGKRMAVIQLREGTCINCKPKIYAKALSFPLARTQKTAWMKNMQRVGGASSTSISWPTKWPCLGISWPTKRPCLGISWPTKRPCLGISWPTKRPCLGISWPTKSGRFGAAVFAVIMDR